MSKGANFFIVSTYKNCPILQHVLHRKSFRINTYKKLRKY
jgi:hypothetical protein